MQSMAIVVAAVILLFCHQITLLAKYKSSPGETAVPFQQSFGGQILYFLVRF
ncbi:hypothetical protein GPAL_1524 [Glaciecola pallidula DSM 14239 = ACAM 615]|uniref:Uncharacterized protein n=1 Tax=Brumicola pallidula DSM 14239 = ACAM 615 TaxID=1121922 RepID=K6YWQ2_9ALTE|nr:hypothetical protein GPAL_1524 [Glaciecola pallidula DSM 14239 = ACAM 615]